MVVFSLLLIERGAHAEDPSVTVQAYRRDLIYRLEEPLCNGLDVTEALSYYLAGRKLLKRDPQQALIQFRKGIEACKGPFAVLPPPTFKPLNFDDVRIEEIQTLTVPEVLWQMMGTEPANDITFKLIKFKVDGLEEYGVVIRPKAVKGRLPLLMYAHGAAFGVPDYALPGCADLARRGYVVAAPAFRGEDALLRSMTKDTWPALKCEGNIENLDGEVRDFLALARAMRREPYVRNGHYGAIGHSFGAGAALLAMARDPDLICMVSYDAWMTNPFRFYWERLAAEGKYDDKSYLWGSWNEFIDNQPARVQLMELRKRSFLHQAEGIRGALLLFTGGAYNGSAYHYSHRQLVQKLRKLKKTFRYEIIPGGGHNFVLYPMQEPARIAAKIQDEWLERYFPPLKPKAAETKGARH